MLDALDRPGAFAASPGPEDRLLLSGDLLNEHDAVVEVVAAGG